MTRALVGAKAQRELARWRMHSLGLLGAPRFADAAEVVGWLGAVQSQDHAPALWAVAQRLRGPGAKARVAVERAFADGAILRTHVLRPTWHFVRPSDIRAWLALTGPRVHAANAYMARKLGLDAKTLARSTDVLARALVGGHHRTRRELEARLARAKIESGGVRSAYIFMYAELNAVIASGAMQGKQHTYALLDERSPGVGEVDRDAALAALVSTYVASHGPTTVKDLAWWSSLTQAEIQRGLAMAGDALASRVIDDVTYWFAGDPPRARSRAMTAHLLQAYDEYAVGYTHSKYVLDAGGHARAARRPSDRAAFNGLIVVDTQLVGMWKRTLARDAVTIATAYYRALDREELAAVSVAAEAHAEYLGVALRMA